MKTNIITALQIGNVPCISPWLRSRGGSRQHDDHGQCRMTFPDHQNNQVQGKTGVIYYVLAPFSPDKFSEGKERYTGRSTDGPIYKTTCFSRSGTSASVNWMNFYFKNRSERHVPSLARAHAACSSRKTPAGDDSPSTAASSQFLSSIKALETP